MASATGGDDLQPRRLVRPALAPAEVVDDHVMAVARTANADDHRATAARPTSPSELSGHAPI